MVEPPPNAAPPTSTSDDPLGSLYRMSRTAGLGNNDYRAVSVAAVVAFILGPLSLLANFDPILLVIPLVGIVFAVFAFRNILASSGTQTGLPLAILGLILCIGCGGWAATSRYRETARTESDRRELVKVVDDFSAAIAANDLDRAYALFSESFHQQVPRQRFAEPWAFYREKRPISNFESNGLFVFENDASTDTRAASGQVTLTFADGQTSLDRPKLLFSTHGGGPWRIDAMPAIYPPNIPGAASTANPGR